MSDARKTPLWARFRPALRMIAIPGAIFLCAVAGSAEEPQAGDGYQAIHGRETFRSFCGSCHGAKADGAGRVAEFLTIKPADLTRISERNGGAFPSERVYKVIDGREKVKGHGTPDMPVWGDVFQSKLASDSERDESPENRADRKISELVSFLSSIQQVSEVGAEAGETRPSDIVGALGRFVESSDPTRQAIRVLERAGHWTSPPRRFFKIPSDCQYSSEETRTVPGSLCVLDLQHGMSFAHTGTSDRAQ